jgi:hypothetical protein
MNTSDKLSIVKEILAGSFMLANEKSMTSGISFSYKSYPVDIAASSTTPEFKAWHFDIITKELGYGEHAVQQLKFPRPNNIDAKNMEYHVLIEVIASLTQTSLLTYYEVAKILNTDKEMQKEIIDEATQSNFTSDQSE